MHWCFVPFDQEDVSLWYKLYLVWPYTDRHVLTIKSNTARNIVYRDLCSRDLSSNLFLPKPSAGTS